MKSRQRNDEIKTKMSTSSSADYFVKYQIGEKTLWHLPDDSRNIKQGSLVYENNGIRFQYENGGYGPEKQPSDPLRIYLYAHPSLKRGTTNSLSDMISYIKKHGDNVYNVNITSSLITVYAFPLYSRSFRYDIGTLTEDDKSIIYDEIGELPYGNRKYTTSYGQNDTKWTLKNCMKMIDGSTSVLLWNDDNIYCGNITPSRFQEWFPKQYELMDIDRYEIRQDCKFGFVTYPNEECPNRIIFDDSYDWTFYISSMTFEGADFRNGFYIIKFSVDGNKYRYLLSSQDRALALVKVITKTKVRPASDGDIFVGSIWYGPFLCEIWNDRHGKIFHVWSCDQYKGTSSFGLSTYPKGKVIVDAYDGHDTVKMIIQLPISKIASHNNEYVDVDSQRVIFASPYDCEAFVNFMISLQK